MAARALEHPAPEPEVDGDVGEHRPSESGCGGKHRRPLDHEEDAQEEGEQACDAKHHATIERVAVDHALVGARTPKMDLRHLRVAELGDVGDDCSGIERDAEDIGFAACHPLRREALARSHCPDALPSEIRPDQPGAD